MSSNMSSAVSCKWADKLNIFLKKVSKTGTFTTNNFLWKNFEKFEESKKQTDMSKSKVNRTFHMNMFISLDSTTKFQNEILNST